MSIDSKAKSTTTEAGSTEQYDRSLQRKRKCNPARPLYRVEDEAIAQQVAMPKSIREFKSFGKLAEHFKLSRMTVYRRSKDPMIRQRIEWLRMHYKHTGALIARRSWEQIVTSHVEAALAGNVKSARFCMEVAWPKDGR